MFAAGYSVSDDQMLNDVDDTENSHIPADLLPVFTPPNPWPTSPNFENDFIMISEFCEIEGPNPLITIPSDGGGDFDKEQFAVNIMSVDYNATNSSRAANGVFTIYDDTCLLQEELSEGAHAYVHHFTLYDIYARGFVRPFCLAYITSEKNKLVVHFDKIINKFKKVTEAFKYGNSRNFCEDLKRKLKDLAFTKENHVSKLQYMATSETVDNIKIRTSYTRVMEELEKAIGETTQILNQFSTLKVNKRLERRFKKMDASENHRRQRVHSQSASLHGDGYHSEGSEMEKGFSIRKCQSNEILDGGHEASYQPKLIKVDGYRKFDVNLRSLQELCLWGAKIAMSKLKRFYKHFSRRSEALSMEKMESNIVKPASSLLTIGRTVTVNFIPENYVQCCKVPYQHPHQSSVCKTCNLDDRISLMTCSSTNTGGPLTDDEDVYSFLPSSFEAKFITGSDFASTESLYYDASDIPSIRDSSSDASSDFNEDWVEIMELSSQRSSSPNHDSGTCTDKHSNSNTSLGDGISGPQQTNGFVPQTMDDFVLKTQLYDSSDRDSLDVDSDMVHSDTEKPNPENNCINSQTSILIRCESGNSLDKFNVPSEPIQVPVGCYVSWLTSNSSRFPGCKLRKILNQYSFSIHLIYALFSGRTVIITGHPKHQKEIKHLITALCVFIPGHSSHSQIIPWYTKPVTIADVGRIKLVGLAKEGSLHRVIPGVVRNYVSIFDFDKQVMYTPPYKGNYLQTLVAQCRLLRSDVSFLAYIQSVFLEMSSKAFLFYHAYCLADHNSKQSNEHFMNSAEEKSTINSFLAKLGITDADSHIIMYWTELIKQQQLNSNSRFASFPLKSIRLDYRICSKFSSNPS
ncbi:guanine nucleotide exchange protein smcr8a-like [Antedon mediterranea]|uniref:guanine nucleotide exchange protein smcr8a-like n=1 Tax=Antedon mediterranea TaxID=105859 RepID=UPI003AF59526